MTRWKQLVMKMNEQIRILLDALCEGLRTSEDIPEDFVQLAATAGQLRRAVLALDKKIPEVHGALQDFEARAGSIPDSVVEAVNPSVTEALNLLEEAAHASVFEDCTEEAERCLDRLDDILSVASAVGRAGRMSSQAVEELGNRVSERVADLAPRLSSVWQHAEDMELSFAPDPDYPDLFSFWEELAWMAPSRRAMEGDLATAFIDPVRRQALLEKARELVRQPLSWVERLRSWTQELTEPLLLPLTAPVAPHTAAGAFADHREEQPQPVEVLLEEPGVLSIVRCGDTITVELPSGQVITTAIVKTTGKEYHPGDRRNLLCIPLSQLPLNRPFQMILLVGEEQVELPGITLTDGRGD